MDTNEKVIQASQVNPLLIGPGGDNSTKKEMNNINTRITMMMAQANADSKYDPEVPKPITKQNIKENFCSSSSYTSMITIIGVLLIVYGIIKK